MMDIITSANGAQASRSQIGTEQEFTGRHTAAAHVVCGSIRSTRTKHVQATKHTEIPPTPSAQVRSGELVVLDSRRG